MWTREEGVKKSENVVDVITGCSIPAILCLHKKLKGSSEFILAECTMVNEKWSHWGDNPIFSSLSGARFSYENFLILPTFKHDNNQSPNKLSYGIAQPKQGCGAESESDLPSLLRLIGRSGVKCIVESVGHYKGAIRRSSFVPQSVITRSADSVPPRTRRLPADHYSRNLLPGIPLHY